MKSIFIFTLIALMGLAMPATVDADNYNDEWTCYSSNNYRGSKKMLRPGEYNNCSSWRYTSWKTKCCVKFYYHKKNGKKGEKVLCGDVRDLKAEMRKWNDLKYGYSGMWRNVYKAVFYCEGQGEQAHNNNNNNNHGNNNYNDYLKKGHCVAWRGSNYGQEFISYSPGKKYYPRDLKWHFSSLRMPKGYYLYFTYKTRSGNTREYECKQDVRDFRTLCRGWDIRDKNKPWDYIQHFEMRKAGMGGNDQANNTGNNNYNDYLKKGHCVVWRGSNYAQEYVSYSPGKKYYPRDLKWHFSSLRMPKGYYLYFTYKTRSGNVKEYECRQDVRDFRTLCRGWDIRDKNKPWDYIQHFEMRKAGMGGNDQANNTGNNNYNDYLKKGHCVVWRGSNYAQEYVSYSPGKKYYPRDLKWHFSSLRMPKGYYLYFTYKTRSGNVKEYECRQDVRDFRTLCRGWDIRDKNKPWDYIQHFEMRKAGMGGNDNSGGGNEDAYKRQTWYNKFKTGYIVMTQYKYYAGRYAAKANGDYDNRKLGFYVQSIYIPSSSRYVVMEYMDRNNRKKSVTIKRHVPDLNRFLLELGVYRDYERDPYKAVKRIAVMRQ